MTIVEAAKGVIPEKCDIITCRVGFNGGDETELDVTGLKDLESLWKSLCPEFGCAEDSVDYVDAYYETKEGLIYEQKEQ